MYVKLTFVYRPWDIRHVAAGLNVILRCKPEIVSELPPGAVADQHSERLKQFMTDRPVASSYYHDCKELSEAQIVEALNQFASHYSNYQNGMPGAGLGGCNPKDNELILNLEIALNNVRNQTKGSFISKNSADNGVDLFERNFC